MSKGFEPTKTSEQSDYSAKCPQEVVLHLRREFDMLLLESRADGAVKTTESCSRRLSAPC